MSTGNLTADPPTANFTSIFEAASNEYKTLIGQDLETHPFAAALEDYSSPDSILNVYRKQARAFDKFCKGDDKLMEYLTPTIYILFTISETLRKGISLVSIYSTLSMIYWSCNIQFLSPSLLRGHFLLLSEFFSGSVSFYIS